MARVSLTVSLLVTLAVGFAVNRAAYQYFSAEELAKAEGQLSLYRSTVLAELEQHSHLTHVLAQDSYVAAALAGDGTAVLNARLKDFSNKAGVDAMYLMTPEGITIAASNFDAPTSFVGQVYAFRPYFQSALSGVQGRLYAIGATTGLPGFFLADPVMVGGDVRGVVALKKSFSGLEESWRRAGQQVILADAQGVVLLASDPDWLYRTLTPLDAEQKAAMRAARQFPGQPLDPLSWQKTSPDRAEILGEERLHLLAQDLPDGWQLHYFASDEQAVTRSWLATAVVVVLAGILLIVFQVQRARRIGRALRRSEQEEAQLRQANAQLAVEVAERKTAEARLKSTQKELAQASRLAALGQLSASVTHELGQPIAAMRNHLAAAEMNPKGAERLGSNIAGLVTRMEGITRQLKFFATSGHEGFEVFELRAAVEAGLELVAPNIEAGGISVQCVWPQEVLRVRGNRLRIEQVVTNILRNACDAMEDMAQAELHIHVFAQETWAVFSVADTGHGLAGAALQDLQEPFVTTRESGQGMGLGLAISATIVKDHGGDMQARDRRHETKEGGAIFEVRLPLVGSGHGLDQSGAYSAQERDII